MPAVPHRRPLRAVLFTLALLVVPLAFAVDGMRSVDPHGLILSHLPPPGSAAYAALKRAAGDPTGQPLEMTTAEMWSVPTQNVEALKRAAAASWRRRHGARSELEPRPAAYGSKFADDAKAERDDARRHGLKGCHGHVDDGSA